MAKTGSTYSKTSTMSSMPGKGNRSQYVNREGKGNLQQTVNRTGKGSLPPGVSVPRPAAKPPISTQPIAAKPKAKPAAVQVVRNTVNERPTPTKKAAPTRAGGLGVTTGKVTGTSATRLGTGGKTAMSAYARQMMNATNKGAMFGLPGGTAKSYSTVARSNSALGGGGGGNGGSTKSAAAQATDRRSSIAGGPNSTGYSNKGQPGSIR